MGGTQRRAIWISFFLVEKLSIMHGFTPSAHIHMCKAIHYICTCIDFSYFLLLLVTFDLSVGVWYYCVEVILSASSQLGRDMCAIERWIQGPFPIPTCLLTFGPPDLLH